MKYFIVDAFTDQPFGGHATIASFSLLHQKGLASGTYPSPALI